MSLTHFIVSMKKVFEDYKYIYIYLYLPSSHLWTLLSNFLYIFPYNCPTRKVLPPMTISFFFFFPNSDHYILLVLPLYHSNCNYSSVSDQLLASQVSVSYAQIEMFRAAKRHGQGTCILKNNTSFLKSIV